MLPLSAVLNLSPAKIVVPTGAPDPPTLAPSEATMVPRTSAELPQTGVISRQVAKNAATISRERAINASQRALRRILTDLVCVNQESPDVQKDTYLTLLVCSGCSLLRLLQCKPTHG